MGTGPGGLHTKVIMLGRIVRPPAVQPISPHLTRIAQAYLTTSVTMPAAVTPPPFTPLGDHKLFTPVKIGRLALDHRIVQAPCTRMRAEQESAGVGVPGDLMVEYYGQRASKGGLQITEATDISKTASGYSHVPGAFTSSQLAGWKRVTDAVHAKGGQIVVQLWYTGRASSSAMRGGEQPLSASNIPMEGSYLDGTACSDDPPRPATVEEIHELTQTWAKTAKAAVEEGGFDGVEIHGEKNCSWLIEEMELICLSRCKRLPTRPVPSRQCEREGRRLRRQRREAMPLPSRGDPGCL